MQQEQAMMQAMATAMDLLTLRLVVEQHLILSFGQTPLPPKTKIILLQEIIR
jgi:hypothetical protein